MKNYKIKGTGTVSGQVIYVEQLNEDMTWRFTMVDYMAFRSTNKRMLIERMAEIKSQHVGFNFELCEVK